MNTSVINSVVLKQNKIEVVKERKIRLKVCGKMQFIKKILSLEDLS